ncbi:MAG: hypothetical protein WC600_11495 [Desulfobaccales bacterium]
MKKLMGLGALWLAGVLAMPGNLWLTGCVYAQEGSKQLTDEQYEQLRQKRQEQWQTLEDIKKRQENTGERLQEGVKRSQDAAKRQKAAEQKLKEMEK